MRVIGTAGHVDHGKSTLVKALTGIDPDRLKEEKEREMTIDLGFAWLTLPSGTTVSIVDVPGHEGFIKNMLAGVGGIDAAMLVIAADEGVMPQTREHLAILDLLQVKGGVVALTKIDVVEGDDWIQMVTADVRKELAGTVLAGARIIPLSSKTRKGIDALLAELDRLLLDVAPKNDTGKPRLPIDRVFTISGFGTVVTGTLVDGAFSVGDEIQVVPSARRGRIRGLETHKEKIERATPGSRVAMNIVGLGVQDIKRGEVVALPGTLDSSTLLDARLKYLASAPKPLSHNAAVDFFTGASQVPARVRLLDHQELNPGELGWVQLHLSAPVALRKGDRFIVRYASPSVTVGGGTVVDAHVRARHRRFRSDVLARLETLARGTPEEIVLQFLAARGPVPCLVKDVAAATGLAADAVESVLAPLLQSGSVVSLGASHFVSAAGWSELAARIARSLDDFHRQFPLRAGLPREELKSRLGLPSRVFDQVVDRAAAGRIIVQNEDLVRRPDFQVEFKPELVSKIDALLREFARAPYTAPSAQEAEAAIGAEALNALVTQGKLVRLNESVVVTPSAFETMQKWVTDTIQAGGQVTAGQLRDRFSTSRKYAIALLEYLDEKRVTRRVGDARVLR
ncbi:MAG: selenocysteine-specific translation elongation factor [Chloroflexi bacterium]|nr:selenocysteine-specific translation elongation factor [Chloroflexota bacterium]